MISRLEIIGLIWFFGTGILSVWFTERLCRLLAWGNAPTPARIRAVKIIGYLALLCGCLVIVEIIVAVNGSNKPPTEINPLGPSPFG